MQFGIVAGPALPGSRFLPSQAAFELFMRMCDAAADCGFDAIGLSHRPLAGPEVQFLHPLTMAALLMARFPQLQVMTNVFLLPYPNPVEVAEQVASLEMIGPGRFLFGVGQGYRSEEAATFQIENRDRGRRMAEAIALLRLLWTQGPTTYAGEFWRVENADIGVKPSNGHGPPILIAADKLETVRLIPERGGDAWLSSARHSKEFLAEALPPYRDALHRAGREFNGIAMTRDICVAKDRATAYALVEESFTRYLHLQHRWGQPGEAYDLDFEALQQDRIILGGVDDAVREVVELNARFGGQMVAFRVYTPGMDVDATIDVIKRVGQEVLPRVREEVGSDAFFG